MLRRIAALRLHLGSNDLLQWTLHQAKDAKNEISIVPVSGNVPYHEDLLPRSNAFAEAQKDSNKITRSRSTKLNSHPLHSLRINFIFIPFSRRIKI